MMNKFYPRISAWRRSESNIINNQFLRRRQSVGYYTKINKRVDGCFSVPMLWQENFCGSLENFNMAYRHLHSVESKIPLDPDYARQYREKMYDYIA